MYDYAVIGIGLIGSAAVRYLSQHAKKVVAIGPAEPEEPWQEHDGVFASHYDQGRITRELDSTHIWADLAQKSMAEYAKIEAESGIRFYHQAGCIQVGPTPQSDKDYIAHTEKIAQELKTPYQKYSARAFRTVVPELHFKEGLSILHEPAIAGYINPRELVQAQLEIAKMQGAEIVRETVTAVQSHLNHIQITTNQGHIIKAKRVLIATGAWTQFLLGKALGLIPRPRTILLAKLGQTEAKRLKSLPAIVFYAGLANPHLDGVYSLPPIQYPDGNIYLKIGGKLKELNVPHHAEQLTQWFQSEGSRLEAAALKEVLFEMVAGLKPDSLHVKPCVTTYTPSGEPLLDEVEPKLFVAAGGCGAAAKSSNEIGRLAAEMVIHTEQS